MSRSPRRWAWPRDGARFDFGRIEGFERKADEWLLAFDRAQLHTDDGLQSGSDFTQEPIVSGNTDEPTVNENRRVRTYVVRNDAEVLVLDNASATCSGLEQPAPPQWRRIGLEKLVDGRLWDEFTQVALTFDPDGFAMRVRLSRGC